MKPTTFNVLLSTLLLSIAALNIVFAAQERRLHASVPMCGGVAAPSANCTCCEESQTWYCE